jgi:hypothetical protein
MVIASKKKAALLSSGGLLIRIASSDLVARVEDVARDDGTVLTPILGDLPRRRLQGTPHDIDADLLIVIGGLQRIKCLKRSHHGYTAPGEDAFLHSNWSSKPKKLD